MRFFAPGYLGLPRVLPRICLHWGRETSILPPKNLPKVQYVKNVMNSLLFENAPWISSFIFISHEIICRRRNLFRKGVRLKLNLVRQTQDQHALMCWIHRPVTITTCVQSHFVTKIMIFFYSAPLGNTTLVLNILELTPSLSLSFVKNKTYAGIFCFATQHSFLELYSPFVFLSSLITFSCI